MNWRVCNYNRSTHYNAVHRFRNTHIGHNRCNYKEAGDTEGNAKQLLVHSNCSVEKEVSL